jgi:gliding motility-associated-like protein
MKIPLHWIFLLLVFLFPWKFSISQTYLDIYIEQPDSMKISDTTVVDATCPGLNDGSISVNLQGGSLPYSFKWSIEKTGSEIKELYPGTYFVKITDNQNCFIRDTFQLQARRESCLKNITAFTPNGDGKNDVWNIPGIKKKFPDAVVYIYNRRGDLIHKADAMDSGTPKGLWDGRYKGRLLPTDTYHYVIINNDKVIKKGHVTLLREN